ncbi:MAG: LPP20 family lipoprotein [Prevotella sp.]|nr:LPP20 family lipoprotein [Bacteroides sp.]MCM1366945.1 LPP20 family lipoprotein [Prevotella sp.]MCM1437171.1 LPP20 family lipoprotein [Prevotella sp.]
MGKLFTLMALCVGIICCNAQSLESIKNNSAYLYGEGWGKTVDEADNNALNDLISKINVHVVGQTSQSEMESASQSGVDTRSQFSSTVKTYSNATLRNTEKTIISSAPKAHVARWIRRADVNKIFEERKEKIRQYVVSAIDAEKNSKIDIALRDFYWAFTLLRSLQSPGSMHYTLPGGSDVLLATWLPHRMEEIMENISVTAGERDGDDIPITFSYRNKPLNEISYSYYDGKDWSPLYTARGGKGMLELVKGYSASNYQVRIDYEYRNDAGIDDEVNSVLASITATPLQNTLRTSVQSVNSVSTTQSDNSVSPTQAVVPPVVNNNTTENPNKQNNKLTSPISIEALRKKVKKKPTRNLQTNPATILLKRR